MSTDTYPFHLSTDWPIVVAAFLVVLVLWASYYSWSELTIRRADHRRRNRPVDLDTMRVDRERRTSPPVDGTPSD